MLHDADWYFDNIVVRGRPARPGPAAKNAAAWCEAAAGAATTPAGSLAVRQGFVLTHAQARAVGLSNADVRRFVRRGEWTAPRRNVLCVLPLRIDDDEGPHGERTEVAAAALVLARPGTVVSRESAAAMHGLPTLIRPPRPTVVLDVARGTGGGSRQAIVHAAALDSAEVTCWFGVRMTSVERTVVDVARDSGVRSGLVVADAALRERLTTIDDLDRAAARASHWRGVRNARQVVALARPGAESVLETLARLMIVEGGLPEPELQVVIPTSSGRYRVDALWRDRRVVLEADGLAKYDEPGSLRREKLRQEAIEREGFVVVRVTWDDVTRQPAATIFRLRTALSRADR